LCANFPARGRGEREREREKGREEGREGGTPQLLDFVNLDKKPASSSSVWLKEQERKDFDNTNSEVCRQPGSEKKIGGKNEEKDKVGGEKTLV